MALDISTDPLYVGRFTAADVNYPFGSSQDETVPGTSNDGTPYIINRANDIFGFQQAILGEDGETPTGNADTAIASQYFDGLMRTSDIYPNVVDSGAVNAIAITPSPAITAYKARQHFKVDVNVTNTGPVTINISGLGAITVQKQGAVALVAFDILEGQFYDFILVSPTIALIQNPEVPNVETKVASSSSELTFAVDSSFLTHKFDFYNFRPATDDTRLFIQVSLDGGSTYRSVATDYTFTLDGSNVSGVITDGTLNDSLIRVNPAAGATGIGNAAGESGLSGQVRMFNPGSNARNTQIQWEVSFKNSSAEETSLSGAGAFQGATTTITNVRFFLNAGNIDVGSIIRSSR